MSIVIQAVKKVVHFVEDLLFWVFEVLLGLVIVVAAVCSILATPARPKPLEILVGDGTLRIGGRTE